MFGVVNYFGIHHFTEPLKPAAKKAALKTTVTKKADAVHTLFPSFPKNRFVDNQDGTITDTATNLMWVKNGWRLDLLSAETWRDATEKSKNFRLGGYSNWRLPSIEEWQTLIDTSKQYPAMVEPNLFKNIITHMPYWSISEFTYDHEHNYNQQSAFKHTVLLYSGSVAHQHNKERALIMPVRSIETQKFESKGETYASQRIIQ